MKNIFNIVLTIFIICFSFYYTNMVSNYLKNKDPIMIRIKINENKYYEDPIDATILNNTMIPGISGKEINIDESYIKMKKINTYQESLLVFKEIEPTTSINNNLDKLIISGNQSISNVSILLKVDDINILKKMLKDKYFKDINFIFTNNFLVKNYDYITTLENNVVINQDDNLNKLDLIDYCYTTNNNSNNTCSLYNKFSIVPTLITHDYYYNTYHIIDNGSILAYTVSSDKNVTEIKLLINGIKNLGYEIVSLDKLVKE